MSDAMSDRLQRLENALIKADAAGNVEDARALAAAIRAERAAMPRADDGTRPPEGMTAQEAAEQAMNFRDTREVQAEAAYRSNPIGAGIVSAGRAMPFVGEYLDDAAGAAASMFGIEGGADRVRRAQEGYEAANPNAALAGQIGMGVATGLGGAVAGARAAATYAPQALTALSRLVPASMTGRVLAGGGAGLAAGAIEGGVSGYGAGNDGDRLTSAAQRAAVGGVAGGALGAAAPVVSRLATGAVEAVRGGVDPNLARRFGTSPEAAEIVGTAIRNDPRFMANIRAAGPDAMLADAGTTTAGLLDASIQRAGSGSGVARDAVARRTTSAARDLSDALDRAMGRPMPAAPLNAVEKARMSQLYNAAYSKPINYAGQGGREIEALLPRIPQDAINAANKMMQLEGVSSRQIIAEIGPNGEAIFRTMPDVRQLDYITRGLNHAAEAGADAGALGGRTAISRLYTNLSREIRDVLKDEVPEYRKALERASNAIDQRKARELGEVALRATVSRADLAEELTGMPEAARKRLVQGMRYHIDEVMANTKRAVADGNMDPREAITALKALSSRASRDKMRDALGAETAEVLASRVARASKAFELRARVSDNSATAMRLAVQQRVKDIVEPNALGELLQEGSLTRASAKLIRTVAGTPANYRSEVEERIFGEIVTLLTTQRGRSAEVAATNLVYALGQSAATRRLAARIGQATGVATAVGGYQAAVPAIAPSGPR